MTREEQNERIVALLLEAFPDETLQIGQRLRKSQVEVLNGAIMIAKYDRQRVTGTPHTSKYDLAGS